VEPDRACARAIHRNLDGLRLRQQMLREDPLEALASPFLAGRFETVLLAPPLGTFGRLQPELARRLPAVLWDAAEVLVVTEAETTPQLPLDPSVTKVHGAVRLTLFETGQLPGSGST
jgi:hypothetical protein